MSLTLLREAISLIIEMRWKGLYKELRRKYPNIPEYVLHDFYRTGMGEHPLYKAFDRLNWHQQVIIVNLSDFAPDTRRRILERQFGAINPYEVHNDEERMARHKELAVSTGKNEPIIVIKRVDGYELYEGWHRTMNILQLGKNGSPPEQWEKVKINAWVGSGKPRIFVS